MITDELDALVQPSQLAGVVETQARDTTQLGLDRVAAIGQLFADFVHDLEAPSCELVEHSQLMIFRVREQAVQHALIHAERRLRVYEVVGEVRVAGKADAVPRTSLQPVQVPADASVRPTIQPQPPSLVVHLDW